MRKCMKILALAGLFTVLLCGSALAADEYVNGAGFYYKTVPGGDLKVTGATASGAAEQVSADVVKVSGETAETYETFYKDSDRLDVVVSKTTSGKQYLVLLAAGSGTDLPTADSEIYYIDQKEATGTNVSFTVIPKLPAVSGPVKLFVTSDDGQAMESAELGYVLNGSYKKQPYMLGDVDGDHEVTSLDAYSVLRHYAEEITLTGSALLAADVNTNGEVESLDAYQILRFYAEEINSFTHSSV